MCEKRITTVQSVNYVTPPTATVRSGQLTKCHDGDTIVEYLKILHILNSDFTLRRRLLALNSHLHSGKTPSVLKVRRLAVMATPRSRELRDLPSISSDVRGYR